MAELERLLAEAANSPLLREEVIADRIAAAARHGFSLTEAEQAIVTAISDEQLAAMLGQLANAPGPPLDDPGVMLSAGISPSSLGIRPERVKGIRSGRVLLATAAATAVVGGTLAVVSMVTGVRPDRPATIERPVKDAGVKADSEKSPRDARPVDAGGAEDGGE